MIVFNKYYKVPIVNNDNKAQNIYLRVKLFLVCVMWY